MASRVKNVSSQTFFDEVGAMYFDTRIEREDETVVEKRLSAEDYFDMFQSSVKKGADYREVVRMPKEVVWAAQAQEADTFKAVVVLPAKVRSVFFCGQILQVPYPALAAYVSVVDGVRRDTRMFALCGEGPDAELCAYPFGNVHSGDGGCCFGNIVVSGIKNAAEATKVTDAFLDGEVNGDLWGFTEAMGEKGIKSQADLYEFLKGLKEFPMELLAKRHKSLKSLCVA